MVTSVCRERSATTLAMHEARVFSKTAGVRTRVRLQDARRDAHVRRGGRVRCAVRGRREPVDPSEARDERADARQADREADVGDRTVGVAKERGGALEPPGEEVLVRRLAERSPELAAEVRRGQVCRAREHRNVEWLAVARVDEVLRPEEMPRRRDGRLQRFSISRAKRGSRLTTARLKAASYSSAVSSSSVCAYVSRMSARISVPVSTRST